ncbi:MAG TPA: TetR/AcrR family transcriptional regulator [Trebonia sp.]
MTPAVPAEPALRGRPRSEKASQAILKAAVELLLDRGLTAVSMDAVAERAGVSKATIYRWWPTKETLALDALYSEWVATAPDPQDTGSLREDLRELLRPWARLLGTRPYARVIAALITEARTDQTFAAEYQRRVVQPRRDQARQIFRRAIERGEVPADIDLEVALDLIYGPLYHRLLHGHAPLDDRFVDAMIDMALTGFTGSAARETTIGGSHRPLPRLSRGRPQEVVRGVPQLALAGGVVCDGHDGSFGVDKHEGTIAQVRPAVIDRHRRERGPGHRGSQPISCTVAPAARASADIRASAFPDLPTSGKSGRRPAAPRAGWPAPWSPDGRGRPWAR